MKDSSLIALTLIPGNGCTLRENIPKKAARRDGWLCASAQSTAQ